MAEQIADEHKSRIAGIKGKELKTFHSDRHNRIKLQLTDQDYLFDDEFYPLAKRILSEISNANPQYKLNTNKVLLGRSPVPNAFCYGNNVLVVNLGLIARLQNESQLAFVISHEMAHQILDHVDSRVRKRIETQNSKTYKKQLKKIKKSDYGKLSAYENFFLDQALKNSSYSRQKEKEADSLAIVLLKNTNYALDEGLNCLDILDHIDQEKFKDSIDFHSFLGSDAFPFQEAWLKKLDGLEVEEKLNEELVDSLKTHPDCKQRIKLLQKHFALGDLMVHTVDEDFKALSVQADFQVLDYYLDKKLYAGSLKYALLLLHYYPDNPYLHAAVGLSLSEIYFAQKNHVLRDYVPRPDDKYDFNSHRILLLVENIRLSQLKKLALIYLDKMNTEQAIEQREEFLLLSKYYIEKINETDQVSGLIEDYQSKYPQGYFTKFIN